MDAYGLRPQIERMLERIAGWGYTVVAPNVFHRDGTVADLIDEREHVFDRVKGLTPDQLLADAPAYLAALRERCADGGIGTTGYCMGARLAVRTGNAHPDDVVAVGGLHGGGLATDDDNSPHLGSAARGRSSSSATPTTTGPCHPRRSAGSARRCRRRGCCSSTTCTRRAARLHHERHPGVPGGGCRAALPGLEELFARTLR